MSGANARLERAQALLPWYVNGTLGEDDRALVKDMLNESLELRREYRRQQALAAAMRSRDADRPSPQRSLERTLARIDRPAGRVLLPALAASLVLAMAGLVLGLVLSRDAGSPAGEAAFRTLADPAQEVPPGALRVVFRAATTRGAVTDAVGRVNGRLVDGPPGAHWVLVVPGAGVTAGEARTRLLAEPGVVYAEPVGNAP
jgi:ferric-dicitrate binding protein FerR (iron transport regulator)